MSRLGSVGALGLARANALQSRRSQGGDADAARVRALAAYKDFPRSGKTLIQTSPSEGSQGRVR
jgi:hypothetical protein